MHNLIVRLRAASAAFVAAQAPPAYAVIYDTPLTNDAYASGDDVEQYYELFSSPREAHDFFRTAYPLPETRNARLVLILGGIDGYR